MHIIIEPALVFPFIIQSSIEYGASPGKHAKEWLQENDIRHCLIGAAWVAVRMKDSYWYALGSFHEKPEETYF